MLVEPEIFAGLFTFPIDCPLHIFLPGSHNDTLSRCLLCGVTAQSA
jgi:hypothetical protein